MTFQPKLFTYSQVFSNSNDLKKISISSEESTNNTLQHQLTWDNYWQLNGEEIVNTAWMRIYKDYILEYSLKDEIQKLIIAEKTDTDLKKEYLENNQTEWQKIWEIHYQKELYECYNLYSENLQAAMTKFQMIEMIVSSESSNDEYIYDDESSELLSLGLPTCFIKSSNCIEKQSKPSMNTDMNVIGIDSNIKCIADRKKKLSRNCNLKHNYRKRRAKQHSLEKIPQYILKNKYLLKYWHKRFHLFSRFDDGIQLDKESWFSVTPEKIAQSIAEKMMNHHIVVDAFCGSGGNSIQLALKCKKVIAIDIDPRKIEMAKHNAKIYNVDTKIEFIVGDFLQLCNNLKADAIFLSPPWGGPKYIKNRVYDIEGHLLPVSATDLIVRCQKITENISLYLPKNSNIKQIIQLAGVGKKVEILQNFLENNLVALTAYFGNLVL